MAIYLEQDSEFIPTWLYVKQHNQTGLKYFGQTKSDNPYTYKGSGKYWLRHLSVHGNDISTIWCYRFTNKQNLVDFATRFSTQNNIEKSKEWANLMNENGLGGFSSASKQKALSPKSRAKAVKTRLTKLKCGKIYLNTAQYILIDPVGNKTVLVGRSNLNKWCNDRGFTRGVVEWILLTQKPTSRGKLKGWTITCRSARCDWI